jgi:hypothetical protein
MSRDQLIRFQCELDSVALELAHSYEKLGGDYFTRMEFMRWVIIQGQSVFEKVISDFGSCSTQFHKFRERQDCGWAMDSEIEEINESPPEYVAHLIYETKFDEDLSDIVDDSINDGSFAKLFEHIKKNEKYHEYECNENI